MGFETRVEESKKEKALYFGELEKYFCGEHLNCGEKFSTLKSFSCNLNRTIRS